MSTADFEPQTSFRPLDDAIVNSVSKDTAFMILKNRRRREVLRYLAQADEVATLDTLARHIAAKENGIDERAISSSQRKRVYIGLYQAHLPKMDDAGVVAFDKHRGRIELRPGAEVVLDYLRVIDVSESAPGPYLAGSLVVGLLTGAAATGLVAVPGLPWLAVLAVAAAAIHATRSEQLESGRLTTPDPLSDAAD